MKEPWERDWTGLGNWRNLSPIEPSIPALVRHLVKTHGQTAALICDDDTTSYAKLVTNSSALARRLLEVGLGKGTRIGIMAPNDERFLITWLAVTRIGAVAVTLPSFAKPPEIARIAQHADLQLLITPLRYLHHDFSERIRHAFPGIDNQSSPYRLRSAPHLRQVWFWCARDVCPSWAAPIDLTAPTSVSADLLRSAEDQVHPSDPAGIIYTSGSTAEPKGVIHSQGSFVRQGLKLAASFEYEPGERALASMPFFWVGGLTTTAMALMCAGGTMLVCSRRGAELLDFLEREQVSAVVTWPHVLRGMADDPSFPKRDWSSMRNGLFFEALPAHRRPTELSLMATPIGMTETNGPYTVVDRFLAEEQRGSVGELMPGTAARLVDSDTGTILGEWQGGDRDAHSHGSIGVLQLRSDTMMLGLVKCAREDVFTPDGWYHTHDLVEFRSGHLHYHGRADDLIKAHGANVSPREVEAVIAREAGVAAVHVVGVPDPDRGTVVGAVIVAEPGALIELETIRKAASASLASYKVPRIMALRAADELPMLPSSKVDRRALVTLLEATASD